MSCLSPPGFIPRTASSNLENDKGGGGGDRSQERFLGWFDLFCLTASQRGL